MPSLYLSALLLFTLSTFPSAFAHPHPLVRRDEPASPPSFTDKHFQGNQAFRQSIEAKHPGLLIDLAVNGQRPEAFVLSCVDSRVPVDVVLNAAPGSFFTDRNIANSYSTADLGALAAVTYAIEHVGVQHLIAVGHTECGGVAAAMSPAPVNGTLSDDRIHDWVQPIRELYQSSTRDEIVAYRRIQNGTVVQENDAFPKADAAAFAALVEENVKMSVENLAADPIVLKAWAAEKAAANATLARRAGEPAAGVALLVHGWVYDVATGEMRDLNITRGFAGLV